jgi:beta-lactamase regulating signal transducer with metallopeptidase domain
MTANDLLALRLAPAAGALFLALTVVLPAFLLYEPLHEVEDTGPLLTLLVLLAAVTATDAARRARAALAAARRLFERCGLGRGHPAAAGFDVVEVPEPIVAVVGTWRPRILVSRRVVEQCDAAELCAVIAHETAHVRTRDNVKLLLLVACPDVLAGLPVGRELLRRWRAAAEVEADDHATGDDPRRRVALAAALVRVARLAAAAGHSPPAFGLSVAADDVEDRVRRLLAPVLVPTHASMRVAHILIGAAVMLAVSAVPAQGWIYAGIERLVAFGR